MNARHKTGEAQRFAGNVRQVAEENEEIGFEEAGIVWNQVAGDETAEETDSYANEHAATKYDCDGDGAE